MLVGKRARVLVGSVGRSIPQTKPIPSVTKSCVGCLQDNSKIPEDNVWKTGTIISETDEMVVLKTDSGLKINANKVDIFLVN